MLTAQTSSPAQPDQEIAAVRAFNRFYTRKLDVLDQHMLKTPFSLSEARVMFELAHRGDLSAKEIGIELGLDAGYLSRILRRFGEDRRDGEAFHEWCRRTPAPELRAAMDGSAVVRS